MYLWYSSDSVCKIDIIGGKFERFVLKIRVYNPRHIRGSRLKNDCLLAISGCRFSVRFHSYSTQLDRKTIRTTLNVVTVDRIRAKAVRKSDRHGFGVRSSYSEQKTRLVVTAQPFTGYDAVATGNRACVAQPDDRNCYIRRSDKFRTYTETRVFDSRIDIHLMCRRRQEQRPVRKNRPL